MDIDLNDLSPDITPAQIREGRQEAGLTQEQLAGVIGCSANSVYRWEAGASPCELPGAVKYALEYLKLRRFILDDEVFRNLDQSISDLQKMRRRIERERAAIEAKLAARR